MHVDAAEAPGNLPAGHLCCISGALGGATFFQVNDAQLQVSVAQSAAQPWGVEVKQAAHPDIPQAMPATLFG